MSTQPVIIVFKDTVSKEQVAKYADDVVKNGGTVTHRYWDSGLINGFSAVLPDQYLEAFKSFRADEIAYVEDDKAVTIQ